MKRLTALYWFLAAVHEDQRTADAGERPSDLLAAFALAFTLATIVGGVYLVASM